MLQLAEFKTLLEKAESGTPLSKQEAYQLMEAPDSFLNELQHVSRIIRYRAFGLNMSYTKNVFIPLTNICRDYCSYCTFRKHPTDPDAMIMTPEEVLSTAKKGKELGCTEVLFSLGDKADYFPEVRAWLNKRNYRNMVEYLEDMCELVIRETGLLPHTNAGVLSRYHLKKLKRVNASMGLMLENVSNRLYEKGGVHEQAPDKKPARRLRHIEEAGKLQIPFTTGILIGIGETREEIVDSLFAIKELHDSYGHIQEVIIQNFRAKTNTPMASAKEPTIEDMIRTVCMANFIFQGKIHLQAPPNLNADHLQEMIDSGVDDWGGISPLTVDYINPEMPWPHRDQLLQLARDNGLVPKQRLPIYPEYIQDQYVHEELRPSILKLSDEKGYRCENR